MNLKKLYDRTNADLWGHPEIAGYYRMGEADSATEKQFDPKIPFEERRKMMKDMDADWRSRINSADAPNTQVIEIPGCEEEPEAGTFLIVTKPEKESKRKRPCIIQYPCGGMAICFDFFNENAFFAEKFNAISVTVHYRTVFDEGGGYPGTVNDCQAAYKYVVEHAEELGINPDKIVLYGLSSGGHIVLSLSHRLKKYNYYGHCPRAVIACSPITDELGIYPSSHYETKAWGGKQVYMMGYGWLGFDHAPTMSEAPDAFPNRASVEDCVGLPPTFIHAPDNDPCLDPDMIYTSKLIQAGVYTGLNVWAGCNHAAFDTAQTQTEFYEIPYAQRWWNEVCAEIADAFKYDFRRPWVADLVKE